MTALVGIVAHAASGKDIRRLVAQAAIISDQAKASIIAQTLVGLEAIGVRNVLLMPDPQHLGLRAVKQVRGEGQRLAPPDVRVLDTKATGGVDDTVQAVSTMRSLGVGCIIVLGGDGTVRAASLEAGEVPILPVSTGTNNVLPYFVDGTIAGMAAGAVAQGLISVDEAGYRSKRLVVSVDGDPAGQALVEAALLNGQFVGSRAVWHAESIREVWAARALADCVGLSSLAATQGPIGPREPFGRWVSLGDESVEALPAVLAPGLVRRISIVASQELLPDRASRTVVEKQSVLTLDGERERAISAGAQLEVTLRLGGPWLVEPREVMRIWSAVAREQLRSR